MKQVTVAFVLMSGKSTLELCPTNKVSTIVGDFEAATWHGAKNVFKDQIKMKGFYFHFTQAIWRKIVNLKIQEDYNLDSGTNYQGILQETNVSTIDVPLGDQIRI